MTKHFKHLILAAAVLTAACSATVEQYIARGDRFFQQQQYAEATIEYRNAALKDPKNGVARMRLAETYLADNETRKAFPEFIAAADLLPDDMEAQLRAGHMLIKGGLFNEAKARARIVLQREPRNVTALVLLGNALGGLKNLEDAIGVLARAVTIDPERTALYTNLGVLELANGERAKSEATFQEAVAVSHGSPEAYVGLGNFYRAVERRADAETALKRAVEAGPEHVEANHAMASFYLETDRAKLAEPHLKTVARFSKDPAARFALANYYATTERPDEAFTILNEIALDGTRFVAAKRDIALVLFMMGRRQEAQAAIDEALIREPLNAVALSMKARLLLADGQPEAALEMARAAVNAEHRLAEGSLTLGRIYLELRDIDGARDAFADALAADPDLLPAQLELVDLHRRRHELDAALRFAEDAVKRHPQSLLARLTRLKILVMTNNQLGRAEAEAKALVARYPASPDAHVALATYHMDFGNAAGARQEFQRALDLNPASIDALTGLVSIDILSRKNGDARLRVEAQLARTPNSHRLLLLAAKIYHVDGALPKTEETLRRAIKANPSDPQAYGLLADLYVSQGRIEEAKKEFTELHRVDPRWVGAPTMLGLLALQTQNPEEARRWWETAVKINPKAGAASNNLAWLLVESNGDLDRALELALAAKSAMPDQAEVNDTLGWIYYKKGMLGQAITWLRWCSDAEPTNATYQFHMGMAYAKDGEDAKAGKALKLALTLDPKLPWADAAKKTLATLIY
jgi:tetratricopeptide (TPR) repeat protein